MPGKCLPLQMDCIETRNLVCFSFCLATRKLVNCSVLYYSDKFAQIPSSSFFLSLLFYLSFNLIVFLFILCLFLSFINSAILFYSLCIYKRISIISIYFISICSYFLLFFNCFVSYFVHV